MKEWKINHGNSGQRLDKFIAKLLPGMPKSLTYKMFRKKNITLNGKKIKGNEILMEGDVIKVFFSDETYKKFSAVVSKKSVSSSVPLPEIIFEDGEILVLNKAVGIFSQPDPGGVSVIDQIDAYYQSKALTLSEGFKPGIANRLDRNTSGIVLSGKTQKAIQQLNALIHDHKAEKIYRTIVVGRIDKARVLEGFLNKDSTANKVTLGGQAGDYINTSIGPIKKSKSFTELEVRITTGKTHQIRAHLASVGHPLIGDAKYGDNVVNQQLKKQFGLKHQLLHAYIYRLTGDTLFSQTYSEGFTAPLPDNYQRIRKGLFYGSTDG